MKMIQFPQYYKNLSIHDDPFDLDELKKANMSTTEGKSCGEDTHQKYLKDPV